VFFSSLCGVGAVQSQTLTVDRQMRRYGVPRLVFINKLDRLGADPWKGINQMRSKLRLNCAAVQVPLGLQNNHSGVIDLVSRQAVTFGGDNGEKVEYHEIPEKSLEMVEEKRQELLNMIADVDDEIMKLMFEGQDPTAEQLRAAIRRATIGLKFSPVFMGSAIRNKGVQLLLDGVLDYLPNPTEIKNVCYNEADKDKENPIDVAPDPSKPLIAYAFKLDEKQYGQLTYMRVYQGTLKKGELITMAGQDKKLKVPRLVRLHASEMEDIDAADAGDICAMFGVDCATGTTFTDGSLKVLMDQMHVPAPVISLAVSTKAKDQDKNFMKALRRFQREDPTFSVLQDGETGETLICGMGELHLEIYIERMKREYNVQLNVGKPRVAYRETLLKKVKFDYTHKKQSGGQGQYAKVIGYLEPLEEEEGTKCLFLNSVIGGTIPPNFIPAVEKGFFDMVEKGPMCSFPMERVRFVVEDGGFHPVDSSELAFRTATQYAVRQAFESNGAGSILEPWMVAEVTTPMEYQNAVTGSLSKRRGIVTDTTMDGDFVTVTADVPANGMFGFSTELRSATQGKAEFSMDYKKHELVTGDDREKIVTKYKGGKRD
jgi:elongation factor G